MSLTVDLSQAVRRAETKKQVARLLGDLPPADRRGVLLDLLAEDDDASTADRHASPSARQSGARRGRPIKRTKNSGPPEAGRTDTLLAALGHSPGMPVKDLAVKVYPDIDEKAAMGRTRSLLSALKESNRVRNTGPGQWEVVE